MSAILRTRVAFRGDETRRVWAVALVLSLAIHAALLAWPRWPSWHEAGGGDPGLAARIVASPASDTAARSPVGEEPKIPDSQKPAARSDAPASVSATTPRPEAPASPARAREPLRAGPAVAPEPSTPRASEPAPRNDAAPSGAIAADAKAPGSASDIASVAQYRIALMSAARRFLHAPDSTGAQGLEGRVDVRLAIAADGSLARAEVVRSSGHAALDELALAMLRSAKSEAPVPPALLAREFEVEVPVVFGSARVSR